MQERDAHDLFSRPSEKDARAVLDENYAHARKEMVKMERDRGFVRDNGKRLAVCVGLKAPGCANDAWHWKELLQTNYDFARKDIKVMTDESLVKLGPRGMNDLTPTKKNLLRELKSCVAEMKSGDSMVFTFAGHGGQVDDRGSDELDGKDEFLSLISPDGKGKDILIDDELYDEVVLPLPKGCKFTAIFDTCRSGGALDLPWELRSARNENGKAIIGNWEKVTDKRQNARADVILISGCASNQKSMGIRNGIKCEGKTSFGGALTTEMIKVLSRNPYGLTYRSLMEKTMGAIYWNHNSGATTQLPKLSSSSRFNFDKIGFAFDGHFGISKTLEWRMANPYAGTPKTNSSHCDGTPRPRYRTYNGIRQFDTSAYKAARDKVDPPPQGAQSKFHMIMTSRLDDLLADFAKLGLTSPAFFAKARAGNNLEAPARCLFDAHDINVYIQLGEKYSVPCTTFRQLPYIVDRVDIIDAWVYLFASYD